MVVTSGSNHDPLRLALITETWPPEINGVAMTLSRLVRGMIACGDQVEVVRPDQGTVYKAAGEEHILRFGVPIPGYNGLRFGFPAKAFLKRRWRRLRPDVVHVATEGPLGISARRAAVSLDIPCTSSFHTNFHSYSQHYGLGFMTHLVLGHLRRFHNRCHCTMVPTGIQATELSQAGFHNMRVLARGVDTDLFRPGRRDDKLRRTWGLSSGDLAVVYVGRLAAEKGLDLLYRAFLAVRKVNPGAKLIMVGDGPERERYQLRDGVICVGEKREKKLAKHYASGDLFLFSSTTETWGNVVLEAMASGLACIAFDYAAAAEVMHDGHDGLKVAMGDETSFLAASRRIAADTALHDRIRAAAPAAIASRSWQSIVEDFRSMLCEAIGGPELRKAG